MNSFAARVVPLAFTVSALWLSAGILPPRTQAADSSSRSSGSSSGTADNSSAVAPVKTSHVAPTIRKTGPHGGKILKREDDLVEIRVDAAQRIVDTYWLGPRKSPPNMSLRLFGGNGDDDTTVELKAVDSPATPYPQFQGTLGPSAGSYSAFEIVLGAPSEQDTKGTTPRTLRSDSPLLSPNARR